MTKKQENIEEIKQLIDYIYLISTFKTKKINFWNWLLGNLKKIRKAIEDGVELFNDRVKLWEELKDINPMEAQKINEYAYNLFKYGEDTKDFIDHIIKGTDHYIKAYKIAEKHKKK